jgi:hypothetical protein
VRLDPDQLEWIVREVVRRLREGSAAKVAPGAANSPAPLPSPDAHVTLPQPLITTATLEHKLAGVTQITIGKRAVITPSARDLLKENNVALTRN